MSFMYIKYFLKLAYQQRWTFLSLQLELLFGGFILTPVSTHHNYTGIQYNIADKNALFMVLWY